MAHSSGTSPIGWYILGKPYCFEDGNELQLEDPTAGTATAISPDASAAPLRCSQCQAPIPGRPPADYDAVADAGTALPLTGPLPPPLDRTAAVHNPGFKARRFLDMLAEASQLYSRRAHGVTVPLLELYRLITVHPQTQQRYSLLQFTEEVQLLASEPATTTRRGLGFRLHPGTAGMRRLDLLRYVTADGVDYYWFGIEFTPR